METTISASAVPLVAYTALLAVLLLAIIVEWQLWAMRHAQQKMEAAIMDRLGKIEEQQTRGASNTAALTTQFRVHQDTTQKKFEDLANRQEIAAMMNNGFTQMAVMLFGGGAGRGVAINVAGQTSTQDQGRQGGAQFDGTNHLGGPVVGGNVGRMEPPGKSERAHTV